MVTSSDGAFGYQRWDPQSPPEYPAGWVDDAPTTATDQSCAICGTADVRWVHPLNPDLLRYRVYGKGHTLPGFWCLCETCEQLYRDAHDAALVDLMKSAADRVWESDADVDEALRKPLAVFRQADRGARPLARD